MLVSLLTSHSPHSLAPGPRLPTFLYSRPRAISPQGQNPRSPSARVPGSSLTLVAVGQEVGTGLQILSVEAVYGDVWILSHLSLEATHSTSQPRRISLPTKPAAEAEECTNPAPTLPGCCCRLTIGRLGSATSNPGTPAARGRGRGAFPLSATWGFKLQSCASAK